MYNNLIELVVDNHTNNKIRQEFIERGINPEIGTYIWRGIGQDCKEGWTEGQYLQWVNKGIRKYGMNLEHSKLVNQLTVKYRKKIQSNGLENFLKN